MASRTWLAVLLSVTVWFVYIRWFGPAPETHEQETAKTAEVPKEKPKAVSVSHKVDKLEYTLSNRFQTVSFGQGGIGQIEVLKYHQTQNIKQPLVILNGQDQPSAFKLSFSNPKIQSEIERSKTFVDKAEKSLKLDKKTNLVRITQDFVQEEGYFLNWNIQIQKLGQSDDFGFVYIPVGSKPIPVDSNDPLRSWEVVYYLNNTLKRVGLDSIETGEKVLQGTSSWISFGNRYFSNVAINNSGKINPDIILTKNETFVGSMLRYPLKFSNDGLITIPLKIYAGPKEYQDLAKIPGLSGLIDYGMFSFVAYPLLHFMKFLYALCHNYGVAIILLTILVRCLFYPLSVKSFRSMKEMQKLQPQINALKERYGNDRERLSREQMALFKTHKVNPAGGCLPLLVQFPVFIALYAVLGNSVDLFQAPFFGWIQDLSSKDPYYIYPILMGISMLVQQKLMPSPGLDPTQAKIMYIMPVVFTFLMVNLPSGLTLYIFISTLLGILQQVAMNRIFAKEGNAVLASSK